MNVAWDSNVSDEPNHDRALQAQVLGSQGAIASLEDLGLRLQDQYRRAPNRADIDRLERGIQNEDSPRPADRRARPPGPNPAEPGYFTRLPGRVHSGPSLVAPSARSATEAHPRGAAAPTG